jgi:hypothetical protein
MIGSRNKAIGYWEFSGVSHMNCMCRDVACNAFFGSVFARHEAIFSCH